MKLQVHRSVFTFVFCLLIAVPSEEAVAEFITLGNVSEGVSGFGDSSTCSQRIRVDLEQGALYYSLGDVEESFVEGAISVQQLRFPLSRESIIRLAGAGLILNLGNPDDAVAAIEARYDSPIAPRDERLAMALAYPGEAGQPQLVEIRLHYGKFNPRTKTYEATVDQLDLTNFFLEENCSN